MVAGRSEGASNNREETLTKLRKSVLRLTEQKGTTLLKTLTLFLGAAIAATTSSELRAMPIQPLPDASPMVPAEAKSREERRSRGSTICATRSSYSAGDPLGS
jgi:hypothetical protein